MASDMFFMGQIMPWAPNFAPVNWAYCNGKLMSINQNPTLFSLLLNRYGGDGINNFALPDLRGRVIVGAGNGPGLTPRTLAEKGGIETVVLTDDQLPAHSHTFQIPATTDRATTDNPVGNVPAKGDMDLYASDGIPTGNITSSTTGANQPISVMQPFTGVNYIICVAGIYPTRT